MPRNITATLEDGTQVVYQNVPDTVKPEEVIARVTKEHGQGVTTLDGGKGNAKADPSTLVGTEKGRYQTRPEPQTPVAPTAPVAEPPKGIWGAVKSYGSDPLRSAGQSLAFLSEGAAAFNDSQSALGRKSKNERSYNELTEKVREALPVPSPETESAGRKYTRAALEAVGGGLVVPLGGVGLGAMLANAVSGLGSEAAAQAFGDNGLTRLLGGLAGGGAARLAGAKAMQVARPNAISLAKEGLEGILPQDLEAAQKLQASSRAQGVNMDLTQALEAVGAHGGNLKRIRDVVAGSKEGNLLQQTLRDQPKELETLGEATIQGLPGKVRQADVAANNLQYAATARVTQARAERTAATLPLYSQAGELRPGFNTRFANVLAETLNRPGIPSDAAAKLREALVTLKSAPGTETTMTHAADYDQLIREISGPWKGQPLSGSGNAFLGELVPKLKQTLRAESPVLEQAAQTHAQISQDVVDPLKKGLVGQFATPRGALPDRAASQVRLQNLLNTGEAVDARGSNIRTFAKELGKVDSEAFPDALKTYLSKKMGEALPADVTNNLSTPDLAAKLHASLFANRNQFNGLRQAAAASAESFGQNPSDVVRGLDNFAQITTALKSRPPGTASMSAANVTDLGKASYSAEALRTLGLIPFGGVARKINELRLGQSLKEFDKILTTPDGAARLATLGKAKLGTQQALEAFAALGTAPTQFSSGANSPGITRE